MKQSIYTISVEYFYVQLFRKDLGLPVLNRLRVVVYWFLQILKGQENTQ